MTMRPVGWGLLVLFMILRRWRKLVRVFYLFCNDRKDGMRPRQVVFSEKGRESRFTAIWLMMGKIWLLGGVLGKGLRMKIAILSSVLVGAFGLFAQAVDYDLVIRNGRVIDGTGNPAVFADVGVAGGKIVAVGKIRGAGEGELDARGRVVAPGFIDVHSHAENIERLPLAENFLRMGVTSLILGNCGSSRTDLEAYYGKLEETGISPNVASLIGHGSVRAKVIGGNTNRAPSAEELAEMKRLVKQAMEAGAVGISTGLIYQPGTFAKTDEIVELAKVAADFDGIYVSHMRNEGNAVIAAIEELVSIAREAKVRAQISHIKVSGNRVWGQSGNVLSLIDRSRSEGIDITQDQYMYTASSTGMRQLIPDSAREGGRDKFRERIADPETREEIVQKMLASLRAAEREDFEYAAIASFGADPSLNGLRVPAAAMKKYGRNDIRAQIDLILEIESEGGAQGVFHSMNEEDVRNFIRHPNTMIASDSGVRAFESGVPHPRGYGNSARVLARYVREQEILTLEDAVRRMTSLPATTFRLQGRGQIAEGFAADLVVFDPESVQDNATFEEPHQYATGFSWVIVNGEIVVAEDGHTEARPGKILRNQTL